MVVYVLFALENNGYVDIEEGELIPRICGIYDEERDARVMQNKLIDIAVNSNFITTRKICDLVIERYEVGQASAFLTDLFTKELKHAQAKANIFKKLLE